MATIMYTEMLQSSRLSFLQKKEIYEAANFYVTSLLTSPFNENNIITITYVKITVFFLRIIHYFFYFVI